MKRLVLLMIALLFVSILPLHTPALAQTPTLKIWVDDQRLPVITELSKQFTADFGVDVVVEPMGIQDTKDALKRGASTGEGPDLYIMPHDNMGDLVESGVAAAIDLGDKADSFLPNSVSAFNYNGKLYGVPFAVENIAMFRNTDLVPDAPATWADVAKIGSELVDAGKAEVAIALPDLGYNYFPVYTAFGGYIFGRDAEGSYNAADLGMDSEGMIAGADWANQLIRGGYASDNLDWEAAHVLFETGKAPFIMSGPWAVDRFKTNKVPYAISAFPAATEGGEPGAPFIGVQGFMINANSKNLLLAQTYLTEFIATEAAQQFIFDKDPRPSAWKSIFDATEDADMKGFAAAGANGQPMPAIPAMGYVWDAWGNAGLLIAQGELTPSEALKEAATQIRTQIKEAK
ncbi:MAG: maltose ABC transporter substrate-binding protein [Anaerolineae bacterium]|nr:maltose ABC transporter substrate-binding protein [Anaerolineae bacterium]